MIEATSVDFVSGFLDTWLPKEILGWGLAALTVFFYTTTIQKSAAHFTLGETAAEREAPDLFVSRSQ